MNDGVFIALEGSDGSGKGTQFRLLTERLKAVGHEVAAFDFPRYDEASSHFVKKYLNGEYGPANEVSPYTASIFYALDRYEASPQIIMALKDGKVVLANRYVGSNMAHQGAKFTSLAEQRGFFMWADSLEYEMLKIPRPSLNLLLKVPPEISYELVAKKQKRSYTAKKRDQHEADKDHIRRAAAAYDLLCKLFPRDFKEINCSTDAKILSVIEINDLIWDVIKPLLPPPKHPGKAVTLQLNAGKAAVKPSAKRTSKNTAKKGEATAALTKIHALRRKIIENSAKIKKTDADTLKAAAGALKLLSESPKLEHLVIFLQDKKSPKKSTTDEPQPLQNIINELATKHLPDTAMIDQAVLVKRAPLNEFELNIGSADTISYADKERQLKESFARNPEQLLKKLAYRFETISSLETVDYLLSNNYVRDVKLEAVGPQFGYEMPEFIVEANLDNDFSECFRLAEANGLLLLGHRARWQFTMNAFSILQAKRAGKKSQFIDSLIELVEESHPLSAIVIKSASLSDKNKDMSLKRIS